MKRSNLAELVPAAMVAMAVAVAMAMAMAGLAAMAAMAAVQDRQGKGKSPGRLPKVPSCLKAR